MHRKIGLHDAAGMTSDQGIAGRIRDRKESQGRRGRWHIECPRPPPVLARTRGENLTITKCELALLTALRGGTLRGALVAAVLAALVAALVAAVIAAALVAAFVAAFVAALIAAALIAAVVAPLVAAVAAAVMAAMIAATTATAESARGDPIFKSLEFETPLRVFVLASHDGGPFVRTLKNWLLRKRKIRHFFKCAVLAPWGIAKIEGVTSDSDHWTTQMH